MVAEPPAGTKSERTRLRILDAAAKVFSEQGYSGARLADIAAQAGMQTGSLYYHFDSREALVEEVLRLGIERSFTETRRQVEALGPGAAPLDRLRAALAAHIGSILARGDYASAHARIFGQLPADLRARNQTDQRAYGAYWNELLADVQRAGLLREGLDLYVVRMLLFGAMNWSAEWYRPDRGRPTELIAEHLVSLALNGILAGD